MNNSNEKTSTSVNSLARDRIAQVYLGLAGGEESQEKSRRRLHWLAAQATGKRVLDVGCSEGMLAILLARGGFEVVGVDVNPDALAYARDLLDEENDFVQQRITLIHADLLAAELQPESFDTVILGEVIEHLIDPASMIQKAFSHLKAGGIFLLTTPFGFHPDPDHRQTFTLTQIVELLKPYCVPERLFVEDNYIRFTGIKQASTPKSWERFNESVLLRVTENATIKQQTSNAEKLQRSNAHLAAANQKYREATKQIDALKKYRVATGHEIPLLKQKFSEALERNNIQRQELLQSLEQIKKIQSSVSYKLGNSLVAAVRSWQGLFKLPVSLGKIFVQGMRHLLKHPERTQSELQIKDSRQTKKESRGRLELKAILPKAKIAAVTQVHAPHAPPIVNLLDRKLVKELKVACIMDEFTNASFAPECNLQQLTPSDWMVELEAFQPELLFIESAWRGKDELWGGKVGHTSQELRGIIEWCRKKAIPTVFWNKEDPIHFQTFLTIAKLFDYVFTTDLDCIHRYKAALGHDRVYLLPFACQPAVHNPMEIYERKDAINFAGAYYVRYPERARDLESFLKALPTFRPVEIYDRNFGKDDSNYQFPPEYQQYIIGTLPFDKIDLAYKGYNYAINLNSIKQSQTMFARRVFELLASNTITISNFSRGLRLLLGDLVITSDSGDHVVRRLNKILDHTDYAGKLKLAALRKVMLEHTYQQRINYVCSKVSGGVNPAESLPSFVVVARVANQGEADRVVERFLAQTLNFKNLVLLASSLVQCTENNSIQYLTTEQASDKLLGDIIGDASWIAGMSADDYYGPNYLLDIAIATKYCKATVIGKGAYFQTNDQDIQLLQTQVTYKYAEKLPLRQAVIKSSLVEKENILQWCDVLAERQLDNGQIFSIDQYNYCRNGASYKSTELLRERVNDLPVLDTGLSIEHLQTLAENQAPATDYPDEPMLDPPQLSELFKKCDSRNIEITLTDRALALSSSLPCGKHEYIYAQYDLAPEELATEGELRCFLDITPGLDVSLVVLFLNAQKERIKERTNHVIFQANQNTTAKIPPATVWLRLGLRILSGGLTEIKGLVVGHRDLQPVQLLGRAEHLVLTNHYPAYHDLYRNAFVHSRLKAYVEKGVKTEVFRLRKNELLSFDEFEGIDLFTGDTGALDKLLASGQYKSLLVHFLNEEMWTIIQKYIEGIKVVVWVHGSEIQAYYRRECAYITDEDRATAKICCEQRISFWRGILKSIPAKLQLVFVSKYLAEVVMEDLGFKLPEKQVNIIHNPINTALFSYEVKPAYQRKKILSIRPYASALYANDLSVKTIQLLATKPWFKEIEFRMIGDGVLFEETLEPLRAFDNVHIERRFLTQSEISELHKKYGIFLTPTRMDTQGVSRDEAMSSGLVPVTNAVAAIPEFVDEDCGIIAPTEDTQALADGIIKLYEHPELFLAMSKAAAERVRRQSSSQTIVQKEMALFLLDQQEMSV